MRKRMAYFYDDFAQVEEARHSEHNFAKKRYTSIVARVYTINSIELPLRRIVHRVARANTSNSHVSVGILSSSSYRNVLLHDTPSAG